MISAAERGGIATRICAEVQSIVQTKNGTFRRDMPGARFPTMVAIKLTPPAIVPTPLTSRPVARKIGPETTGKSLLGEGSIGKPTDVWWITGEKTEVNDQSAEERRPKTERIHAGECHVAGTNHQRNKIIPDTDENGHPDKKHHRGAMHREELIEQFGGNDRGARPKQLTANEHCLGATDDEKYKRHQNVQNPNLLVIDGG